VERPAGTACPHWAGHCVTPKDHTTHDVYRKGKVYDGTPEERMGEAAYVIDRLASASYDGE